MAVNAQRVERLMGAAGIQGGTRRRRRGCTRRDPHAIPSDGLVNRAFNPDSPDRLWMADITQHPTGTGKIYLAVLITHEQLPTRYSTTSSASTNPSCATRRCDTSHPSNSNSAAPPRGCGMIRYAQTVREEELQCC